jgi:hypothetical protein
MEAKGSYNKNAAIPAAGGGLALPLLAFKRRGRFPGAEVQHSR